MVMAISIRMQFSWSSWNGFYSFWYFL